jgi:ADP-ribosylglycohydrolase
MLSTPLVQSHIEGAILGHIIGDALSFKRSSTAYQSGYYTYRSSLLLCTIYSIQETKEINLVDMMDRFRDFYVAGFMSPGDECLGVPESINLAIKNHSLGMPPDRCGIKDDLQDDSLTRILPIALYCAALPFEGVIKIVNDVTEITHNNLLCKVCNILYSLLIRSLLHQKGEKVFQLLEEHYSQKEMYGHLNILRDIMDPEHHNIPIINTFWAAWKSYAQHQIEFDDCIKKCLEKDNNESVCPLAGSLVGLTIGRNEIPEQYIREINLDPQVTNLIKQFSKEVSGRISVIYPQPFTFVEHLRTMVGDGFLVYDDIREVDSTIEHYGQYQLISTGIIERIMAFVADKPKPPTPLASRRGPLRRQSNKTHNRHTT